MTKRKTLKQKLLNLAEDEVIKIVKKSIHKPKEPSRFKDDDKVF